jgi:hypothetical protein
MASLGSPFAFVLTMGLVNLFGDTTYEGGGAIHGQFEADVTRIAPVVANVVYVAAGKRVRSPPIRLTRTSECAG